jgi:hypothetical protein
MNKRKTYPILKRAGWVHGSEGVYLNTRGVYGVRSQCAYCGAISAGYNPHRFGPCRVKAAKAATDTGVGR